MRTSVEKGGGGVKVRQQKGTQLKNKTRSEAFKFEYPFLKYQVRFSTIFKRVPWH